MSHVPDEECTQQRTRIDDRQTVINMVQKNQPFSDAIIGPVDLSGANLRGGNFMYALFEGTNLEGADLKGANLSGANLRTANMRYATVYRCNVYKTALPLEIPAEEITLSIQEGTRLRYNKMLELLADLTRVLVKDRGMNEP
jgi:uncharacterized protein YjbI with pentapeptide repeats